MKIVEFAIHTVPVNHRGDWVFVELTDDSGTCGLGEASGSADDPRVVADMEARLRPLLDAEYEEAALLQKLWDSAPADFVPRVAASAIEQAAMDLIVRRSGKSVAEHLAADPSAIRGDVPFYANLNRMCRDRSPETAAAAARQAVAGGLRRVKFAPFDEVSPDKLARDGVDIAQPGAERLRALRDAIGPDIALMVDCHWRFTTETLPFLADLARELSIGWIEDPMRVLDPADMQDLRDRSGARIAGGEALLMHQDFVDLATSGAVDVLIADVKFVGGIGPLDRICKMAAENGVTFAPHNPTGPISTAASAHVVAANPNAEVLEFPFGEVPWRGDLAVGETITGDRVSVRGPGLGVILDFAAAGEPAL